jgi:uncharacterized protein DUF4235
MAQKQMDIRTRVVSGLAAMAAGFVARKITVFAWTRVTGRTPPDDPQDPEVALVEAIGFAVVLGVGMEVARLIATRTATRVLRANTAEPAD